LFSKSRHLYPQESFFKLGGIPGLLVNDFFNLGKIGVVVFFFVSGYVIPYSLNNRTLGEFAKTRFFRLYPAYWLSIILSVILIGVPSLLVVITNVTMFQKFVGVADLNVGYWTLQIELIFYMICAVLHYKGLLYHNRTITLGFYLFLVAGLLLAIVRYMTGLKLPVAVPLALDVMFLGLMFRKLSNKDDVFTSSKILKYVVIFVAALLPICFLAYNKDYGYDEKWYKYFSSYILAIVFFVLFFKFKWNNKLFSFMGAISYSLYLLHPVVGFGGMKYVRNMFPSISSFNYILLFMAFSVVSAILSYYLIEKPSVRLGKLFIKSKKKPAQPITVATAVVTEN
jgi:peptidoglycan/LPS O-acetylase OafA/YrhL